MGYDSIVPNPALHLTASRTTDSPIQMIFQKQNPATALNVHSIFYKIAFAGLLVVSTSALASTYFEMFAWNTDPRTELYKMVYGLASKPFVTRALVPLLIRSVATILPLPLNWIANAVMWLALLAYTGGMLHLVSALWQRSILTDVLVWGALISLYPLIVRAHNIANMNSSAKAHDIANTEITIPAPGQLWSHAFSHKETAWTTKTNSGAGGRQSVYG